MLAPWRLRTVPGEPSKDFGYTVAIAIWHIKNSNYTHAFSCRQYFMNQNDHYLQIVLSFKSANSTVCHHNSTKGCTCTPSNSPGIYTSCVYVYTECYLQFLIMSYLQSSDNRPTYLTLSIFAALCCCLPLGMLAVVCSIKVYYDLMHIIIRLKQEKLLILFRLKKLILMEGMKKDINLPRKLPPFLLSAFH